jgi:fructose-bisphosphate aldolase class II
MDLKNYKGVLHGDQVQELFEAAKKHQFALPAVNVIGTNTINAVMETAKAGKLPGYYSAIKWRRTVLRRQIIR